MTERQVRVWALALLAALALTVPLVEMALTGRVEELGAYALAQNLLSVPPIFWWYHADKARHGYRAGPLMNAGVVAAAILALPVYFIRTRGWQRGAVSIAKGVAVVAGIMLLGELGEIIGGAITR